MCKRFGAVCGGFLVAALLSGPFGGDVSAGVIGSQIKCVPISAGWSHSLALKATGSIVAWGRNNEGQTNAPAGDDFVSVAAGDYHSLALKTDGSIVVWGNGNYGLTTPPAGNDFVSVVGGGSQSLALRSDGSIVGWGRNDYGQANAPAGSNYAAIAAGEFHSLALRTNGTLLGWGYNYYGQATVPTGSNFVAIAAGNYHSVALKSDGSIMAWGDEYQTNAPAGTDFVAIAAGGYFSLALRADGSLAAWGSESQVRDHVPAGNDFVAIAGGGFHALALRADGSVIGWGESYLGQLDVPAPNTGFGLDCSGVSPSSGPWAGGYTVTIRGENLGNGSDITNVTLAGVQVSSIVSQSSTKVAVVAGASYSGFAIGDVVVASTSSGETVATNAFTYDAPGLQVLGTNGAVIASNEPVSAEKGTIYPLLAVGETYVRTFALTNNGSETLVIDGLGIAGGSGMFGVSLSGPLAAGATGHVSIAFAPTTAGTFSAVLDLSHNAPPIGLSKVNLQGSAYSASMNAGPYAGGNTVTITNGYFGTITNVVVGGTSVTPLASGTSWFTVVMPALGAAGPVDIVVQTSNNGDITLAGAYTYNPAGQILDAGLVEGGPYIAGGGYHTLGLKSDGSIVAWGRNDLDQVTVPTPNTDFVAVVAGAHHSLGLKVDGSLAAWGANGDGQANIPVPNSNFIGAAAGAYHSLGLKADGSIIAWGYNGSGQITVPAPNTDFVAVAGGGNHSLGLKSDGSIVAWGDNSHGQSEVPSPNTDFVAVAGGWTHSLGLKSDGSIVAWGHNGSGQTIVPTPNADFAGIGAGAHHSLGLKSDGSILAWGQNGDGQANVPLPNADFVAVAGGWLHSLGLKSDGSIVAWGQNSYGQTNVPSPNTDFGLFDHGVNPASGSWTGGYDVVISGTNLSTGVIGDIGWVTLAGVTASVQSVSGSTQIVVTAGQSPTTGIGAVRVFSTSFGVTVKSNAFAYLRAAQSPLVFAPTSPQAYNTTNVLSVSGGSGTGAVSFAYQSGPGQLVGTNRLHVTAGAGTVTIVATKAQDSLYFATSATGTVAAAKAPQAITFPNPGLQIVTNETPIAATASSGLQVSLAVVSGAAGLTGPTSPTSLTYGSPGWVTLRATQSGDDNWAAAAAVQISFRVRGDRVPYADFDGDGRSDLTVFWPEDGNWYHWLSASDNIRERGWGWSAITPVPGDYDGDGIADLAVYHQPTGDWYIRKSRDGKKIQRQFGHWAAEAVPGDFDGDGRTDLAVHHRKTGKWHIISPDFTGYREVMFGWRETIPVPADYDGDGITDVAVYWPPKGRWHILRSSDGQYVEHDWGFAGATPVPADYDGDGITDLAVYASQTGTWYIRQSSDGQFRETRFGWHRCVPVPGDYDGDGIDDLAVYEPIEGRWSILHAPDRFTTLIFGWQEALPPWPTVFGPTRK